MIEQFRQNISDIKSRVKNAAEKSGRVASDVTLIGVTKYVGVELTELMFQAGCQDLGESRPQLLWEKSAAMESLPVRWHLIGHLQRNKVKRTIPICHLIHSVDSQRLLQTISDCAVAENLVTSVLLEVNVSGEAAKHGLAPGDVAAMIEFARRCPGVRVKGLMCMAGLQGTVDDARREFASLRELSERLKVSCGGNVALDELSMGMSGDFEIAIEEGATLVRVGSLLFKGT